jgi:lipid A 3-O-deacylase
MFALVFLSIALFLPLAAARAESDGASIWTLQGENAAISLQRPRDHFYTNGLRLGWVSPGTMVPGRLAELTRDLWGDGETRMGVALSQRIDTPADTHTANPSPRGQPYAGLLLGEFAVLTDTATTRKILSLGLGVVGPLAGAENFQNGFHDLIGRPRVDGWGHQIPNTAAVELTHEQIWRFGLGTAAGAEVDVLPSMAIGVGDLRDYVQAGITVRIGHGLEADFGVPRPRPGLNGGDAYSPLPEPSWYVFAGANAQAIAYDLRLQAASFRSGPHVWPVWDVAELQGGFAIMVGGMRLTLSYVAQTPEFHGQSGGLHQFASASLSLRF